MQNFTTGVSEKDRVEKMLEHTFFDDLELDSITLGKPYEMKGIPRIPVIRLNLTGDSIGGALLGVLRLSYIYLEKQEVKLNPLQQRSY